VAKKKSINIIFEEDLSDNQIKRYRKDIGELFSSNESLQYLLHFCKGRRKNLLNTLDSVEDLKSIFQAQGGRREIKEIINYVENCIDDSKQKDNKEE